MIALPRKIYLASMNKTWRVSYIRSSEKLVIVEQPHHRLVLYGKNYSKRAALQLIAKWIRLKAHNHLIHVFIKLSHQTKIKYKKVIIRSQKTQWGNCSSKKIISINYKVIFLPPVLVKHLMLHELCHIQHLNHSEAFWKALEKFDKNWKKNGRQLYNAIRYIPDWLM